MARKKQPEKEAKTDGWLNTYADMVTLLLCFFVMMYTASVPDEAKMQWILQSFSSLRGTVVNPVAVKDPDDSVAGDDDSPGPHFPDPKEDGDLPGVIGPDPMTFEDMFNWVAKAVEDSNLSSAISIEMKDGRMHIRFDSDVMFAPDSYTLLPTGRQALNLIVPGIKYANPYIASVIAEGHTAGQPGGTRRQIDDWFLSSQRAVAVINYLDFDRDMVDSEKFNTSGFGPWKPYASNDIEDSRLKNRRVELVITRNSYQPEDTDVMIAVLNHDYRLQPLPMGPNDGKQGQGGEHERDEQIMQNLLEHFGMDEDTFLGRDTGGAYDFPIPGVPTLPKGTGTSPSPSPSTDNNGGTAE